ncbi:hypothetical protein DUI87_13625 [Hirundo rustica rustica]|uniref:Uncharacterized protein n=1 Tax=Hirundo rustica rustica TaxID=333673 RepID=A0A3M0K9I6_HIRRU|nr:hypothetical protein DUI87_13625 [Hirundo rustica rustica]
MSKTVSSVLVVNKNGGDVGEDEAKKPYKYDCLYSENVKPVGEIELKTGEFEGECETIPSMPKHTDACIVSIRFEIMGITAVSGAKSAITSEIPVCAATEIWYCATLYPGNGGSGEVPVNQQLGGVLSRKGEEMEARFSPEAPTKMVLIGKWNVVLVGPLLDNKTKQYFRNILEDATFLVFHLVSFLYTVCSFSRRRAEFSRGADETPDTEVDPGVENPEWCGEWERMGQTLKEFSDPPALEFSREQIQNPDERKEEPHLRRLSHRRKEPKTKQVSVSTQAVTEEKETKGAISISTQTVTEAEQPKPVAVAPVQKKKLKSKSVRIVTDEDVAGPSHPAEETEPEIITHSLSLGELRDLRREFTCQTNESILTWLLCIWDAAANDTILDGSEARQLGSLSWDVVIDQGIGRTQQTLSLWRRLLTSVRDRYLCKEDLQVHQGKWSTMEQGIRCLRELAVLEIIFSEDERFPKSPDDVQCTLQMWLRFARLGPEMYSHYLATLQWREGEDKVGVLVNKLRIYEDTVTAPFRTHVSSVETRLAEQVQSLIEEGHQKLKKELKEEIYHISPEPTRVSAIRSRYPSARERGYTPWGNLWSFLREHGEDMRNWDGKPTSSLAARVRELKRETPTTKSSSRVNAAPISQSQNSRWYRKDDMTDPLKGTLGTYLKEESDVYHDQE